MILDKNMRNSKKTQDKFEYMTTTPVGPLIGTLAVPTIISMLVNTFYNLVDSYFVGKLETSAAGAVGVVYPFTMILQAIAFYFGHGSGNFVSRKLGEKADDEAETMVSCGFFYALFIGIIFMAGGLLFREPLVDFLGSTETIKPYAVDYLFYILLGTPFFMTSLVINNHLRFQGNALYGMIGMVTGAVINMVLDPILILEMDMGVKGAAIATSASQFVSFLLLLVGTTKGGSIRIRLRKFSLRFYYFKEIFRGGVPSLFRQGLGSLAAVFLNQVAGPIGGDAAITGMSIVSRITLFANSALIGFGQGFQPVCGFNYGAGKFGRVREAFLFCVRYAFAALILLSVLGWVFAPDLLILFKENDPAVVEVGTRALRFQCVTFPLGAWIIMANMMLQSVGRAFSASVTAAARQGLFFIPLILLLPRYFAIEGIFYAQPLADVCTFLLSLPLALHFLEEMKTRS